MEYLKISAKRNVVKIIKARPVGPNEDSVQSLPQ